MSRHHQRIWVGIDAGKAHRWAVGLDAEGNRLFSRKVAGDEQEIAGLIEMACGVAEQVRWAVDVSSRPSALLLALLAGRGQPVAYIPGRTVNRMAGAYSGEGKTDAKDAAIIADTLRMRRDFRPVGAAAERASELGLLTSYRRDLVADRVRMVNRLREVLAGICPALERQFQYRRRPGARAVERVPDALVSATDRRPPACCMAGAPRRPQPRDHRRQGRPGRPGSARGAARGAAGSPLIHTQAVLCLARRRVNVVWAMLRDQRPYLKAPPLAANSWEYALPR